MKIYVLLKQRYNDVYEAVCVSGNVNDVRKSICKDLSPTDDYPKFEIWEDGRKISEIEGNDVLKAVADELKTI